jgi:hypothetical protein
MPKFDDDKKCVTFSLVFLILPPSFKFFFQALMLQRICIHDLGLRMRKWEKKLWEILKIFAKYCRPNVNVARNKKNKLKECDR